jgi:xylulokinase
VTVGVDIGTTSVKAVAADASGAIVDRIRIPHALLVPAADKLEHDADRAWRRGPRRAFRQFASLSPAAVAVASMMPSMSAVDRAGRPVSPGLIYGDGRGDREGDEGIGFVRWLAHEYPKASAYWPSTAVANYALGGVAAIDIAVAMSCGSLFTGEKWNAETCASVGVDPSQLPDVAHPGSPLGHVRGTDAVLGTGFVDVMCEQLVSGADQVGDVHVQCGTSLLIWAISDAERQVPGLWTYPHLSGNWSIGGVSNAGGLFLDWVNRMIGRVPSGGALDPHDIPVWQPYPRGERTPYHDRSRRASIDGLNLTHGPAALQRAAWEASGFVVRHHLDLIGITPKRIVVTGGGTRLEGWMRALADCTGAEIHVAAEPEGAALGAAYLARMALGEVSDFSEAASWARTGTTIEPDNSWTGAVADRYARFRELSDGKAS